MLYIYNVKQQQITTTIMTTTNDFNQEVFPNGTSMATILTYGLKEGADKMEKVIRNTYTKENANTIIELINSINYNL